MIPVYYFLKRIRTYRARIFYLAQRYAYSILIELCVQVDDDASSVARWRHQKAKPEITSDVIAVLLLQSKVG